MTDPRTQPTGTVTFLFTDVEGSTRRWESDPGGMRAAFSRQEVLIREAIASHGGYAYKMIGDAFQAAFPTAVQGVQAAVQAQRALQSEDWGAGGEIRVRMALHTGVTEERSDDYVGPALNRVSRLLSTASGGQILLTSATQQLLRDDLPEGVTLMDMGLHRLRDLALPEHIFQLVAEDLPSEFPPLKTLDSRPNNLPLQSTQFIGREEELASVRDKLLRENVRLLTITGPGGMGKTRLALQAAAEMLDQFPDGVFFVNLAPIIASNLVIPTIAHALSLREVGGQPIVATLTEYLRDKELLLVLDNFEHVLDAAPAMSDLLKSAPHLKALVTSRSALRLSLEYEHVISPLRLPDPKKLSTLESLTQYEAVELFISRAQAVRSDFEVNNQNAPAVAEICYRLEGIPLAIELAAARIRASTPQAILSRLDSRLKLLTGGAMDLPARQQTLRNTLEWSHDLLDGEEQKLFRRMSVFQGGRALEALEAVCGGVEGKDWERAIGESDNPPTISQSLTPLDIDVLDGVESLVSKSLLQQREGSDGEPRFWMLETMHEYAREKLQESGEAEELTKRHAYYYLALAQEVSPHLTGAQQSEWLARLDDEHDNLRAALAWARESADVWVGLRLAGAIWWYWYVRTYLTEGREWLEGALAHVSGAPESLNATTNREQREAQAAALNGAGALAYRQGDYSSARSFYEQSLSIRREFGDRQGIARSLYNLGLVAYTQGDYPSARALNEESLAIGRELGDKHGVSYLLNSMGNMAYTQGDYSSAWSLYEESLSLHRELGDKLGIASSLHNLGMVAQDQENYSSARALHMESLSLRRELGFQLGIVASLGRLGVLAVKEAEAGLRRGGETVSSTSKESAIRGAVLLGAAEALLEAISASFESMEHKAYEQAVATAHDLLGDADWEVARQQGRALSLEQAIASALEES